MLEAPCGPWHVAAADAMPFMGGGFVQRQLEFRVGARAWTWHHRDAAKECFR